MFPDVDIIAPLRDPVPDRIPDQKSRNLAIGKPTKIDLLLKRRNRKLGLDDRYVAHVGNRDPEVQDAAGSGEHDLSYRPGTLDATAEDPEHGLNKDRHPPRLAVIVEVQAHRVFEAHARNRDMRPGNGHSVMEIPQVRSVAGILDKFDHVHANATGVVVPAEGEAPIIDFPDSGDRIWNLFAGPLLGFAAPVIHENLPVHLLYGETLGRHAGRHGVTVGHTGRSSVTRELPTVKRTLNAVLADAAVREVSAKVRAKRRHRKYVVRVLAPPDDQCAAQTLQIARLPAPKRLRTEQPIPAVGIGRWITGETQVVGEVLWLPASQTASQEAHASIPPPTLLRRMWEPSPR